MSQTLECAFNNATLGPNLPVWPVQVLFFICECLFLSSKNLQELFEKFHFCLAMVPNHPPKTQSLKINIVEFKIFRKLTPHPIAI